MKKTVLSIVAGALAVTTYLVFSHRTGGDAPQTEPTRAPVRHVAAEGKVEAMPGLDVEVGSELTARIERLFVKEGDRVTKGQVIARLEQGEIQAKLKEAEGELAVAKAKLKEIASGPRKEEIQKARAILEETVAGAQLTSKNLDRSRQLYKDGMVSRLSLDERETAFAVAMAKVRQVEEDVRLLEQGPKQETVQMHEDSVRRAEATVQYYTRLVEKTTITAPISGKVIHQYLDGGEMIRPETPLVAIADVDQIRINAEVDETDIGRIRIGDPVEVRSDTFPGQVFKGRIQEIADYVGSRKVRPNNPAVNLGLKIVQVKIELEGHTPFKLGMTVDVKIVPRGDEASPGNHRRS